MEHMKNFKPSRKKIDKKRILSFCDKIGVMLPEDYQKFLLEYNGGIFEPSMQFRIPEFNCKVELEYLYGFDYDTPQGVTNIEKSYQYNFNYDLDGKTLVIGHCEAEEGYLCLMLLSLENMSGIYVCDLFYDEFALKQSSEENNIFKITDTFSEFLDLLK